METVRISSDFSMIIPTTLRSSLSAGLEMVITIDHQGRLILTPIEKVRSTLEETFGIWADREDIPKRSVDYVNKIRRGKRLRNFGIRK